MNDDLTLLREFAASQSEAAFAALVARHVNLVYSVARRQVNDPHLAEEITQAVFIILARKADKISPSVVLSGWLCRTARYVGAEALRKQHRRRQREQEAYMQSTLNRGGDAPSQPSDETWPHIAPLLDGALETLGRKDHDALVLRFFENKNFAEVGAALGANEDTARMRVNRALEKLRKFFTKRGVDSTTAIIAGAISANSVQAAPVGLAKAVTAIAVAKGATASISTLTLIKGALKIMAWTKAKMTIVVAVASILVAGTATVVVNYERAHPASRKLTLKINPEVFVRNVKARAAETMHLPSDPWGDIWLDILTMARVDSTPPHATEFNLNDGTIAMSNTPAALEIFRQVVEELNRPDGKRDMLPPNFDTKHAILIVSHFYKMSSTDFERLNLGAPSAKDGTNSSGWWMLDSNAIATLKQSLQTAGIRPFQSPRIQTAFGELAEFFVGNSAQGKGVEFDFLPMRLFKAPYDKDVTEDMIDLKAQVSTSGEFTSNPAGDWPDFSGRTNCAIFTRALVVHGYGLLFREENPLNSESNNLVILSELSVKSASSPR